MKATDRFMKTMCEAYAMFNLKDCSKDVSLCDKRGCLYEGCDQNKQMESTI